MTQTTPKLALVKPGGGSTGLNTPPDRVDIDVLNGNFDKIDANAADVDARLAALVPAGSISMFAGATAPDGYFICDGSLKSRATHVALFTAIGTAYGAGDGSTTFALPNLAGRVPVGRNSADTAFDVLGETGGEKTHVLTSAEMPAHNHGLRRSSDEAPNFGLQVAGAGFVNRVFVTGGGFGDGTDPAGGGQAHNNLQPYLVMNFIIKA